MGPASNDSPHKRFSGVAPPAALIFFVLVFVGGAIVTLDHKENLSILQLHPMVVTEEETRAPASEVRAAGAGEREELSGAGEREELAGSSICENQSRPSGSEPLPKGIVQDKSNFEMESLGGNPERRSVAGRPAKSLLAIPVGIKQKAVVDKLVSKFPGDRFTVMLFHYDGAVDGWRDLRWSDRAIHVAAIDQTKWWFGKRFLHPDMVADYDYIFLWDEDIEVDGFDPIRYLKVVKREGLEISQPALDRRSQIHHRLTLRSRKGQVHRRFYKTRGGGRCDGNSTGPPCTGWVEMMVPVFSRAAWRCAWHMIQNDLIYAWGLDFKLGYCARGDRRLNVGIVDSEYVLHRGIPTLGDGGGKAAPSTKAATDRLAVRQRSYTELQIFNRRWKAAAAEDVCWTDPYPS
ncbi:uncharacterized protein LOC102709336 [Oryza brachyantha]|uniref:uncharacterized protein LOC102709336 n=1 Tax=Oryza brachyantha TaxID=4533 RepID=UPI0007762B50|nr:uncharacterized protein LOC102709336 [Oryza brachyantha]